MRRRVMLLCILIVVLVISTGCWNRRELNELAIIMAFGLDKAGEQFVVTAQVVNPGQVAAKEGGGGRSPVVTFQKRGDTIHEAIRKITTVSPRKLYGAHVRMVVIGEDLAKEGFGEALDLLSRDAEIRTDFFIVVAKEEKAEDVLHVLTTLEQIPANKMYSSLEASANAWAPSATVTLDQLLSDLVSKGKHPVLTGIQVKGDSETGGRKENVETIDSPVRLQYSGLAVFKKDQLAGWLNEKESKGYNYIRDQVQSTVDDVICPQRGKLALEVIRSKTEIKGKVVNGRPQIVIDVRTEENISDVECSIDLTRNETIQELEKLGEQSIKDIIATSVHKVQKKYKVDIFGFGEVIRRSNPQYWKKVENNWDQEFADLSVQVKVDVKIRRIGSAGNSILNELKE
ncbi:Ger(x)C family spore germination protein [Paenibacillus alkaliterrae]|nr:Ger(x)C family spore germination protein [Paenibacillus alkaliterrae]